MGNDPDPIGESSLEASILPSEVPTNKRRGPGRVIGKKAWADGGSG
jgi:hypothetical protein